MTRENLLFAIIGILLGFIVGFMLASSISQKQTMQQATASRPAMPADHPAMSTQPNAVDPQAVRNQVTASLEQARNEPNNFDAQIRAADLYAQIGRFEQGIEFLIKANQLKPSDYDTIVRLGAFNVEAEHFEAAEKWYRAAMKMRSDDIRVLAGMAAVMLGKGDARAAEDAIAKLEQASPNSVDLAQFRDRLATLKAGR
jgi:tetratricopeptide (TPR) repeat protein